MDLSAISTMLRSAFEGRVGNHEIHLVELREIDGGLRATLQALTYEGAQLRDLGEEDVLLVRDAAALAPAGLAAHIAALGAAFRASEAAGVASEWTVMPSDLLASALPAAPPPYPIGDEAAAILAALDARAATFEFPMLDNGYVYLARARMTLFRGRGEWAITIETFGYSPRAGIPSTSVQTFGSALVVPKTRADFASEDAWQHARRERRAFQFHGTSPIDEATWPREAPVTACTVAVRGVSCELPGSDALAAWHAETAAWEFGSGATQWDAMAARYLAEHHAERVLATDAERRRAVGDLEAILTLDEWRHPNLVVDERPSEVDSFRRLAEALATGDLSHYEPTEEPNTHWRFWPGGGAL